METLGKEVGNSLNSMLEATIITNLAYVDLMSFENVEILEENLILMIMRKFHLKEVIKMVYIELMCLLKTIVTFGLS